MQLGVGIVPGGARTAVRRTHSRISRAVRIGATGSRRPATQVLVGAYTPPPPVRLLDHGMRSPLPR